MVTCAKKDEHSSFLCIVMCKNAQFNLVEQHNWDDLKFILAVAKAGSVNSAAQVLGKNHATVLRRIASFENARGITVFQRSAKGYVVTPKARPIIEALEKVEASVDAMERAIASKEETLEGKVFVTSTDSLCRTILPPIVKGFLELHPKVSLEMIATNSRLDLAKLDAEMTVRPAVALPPDLVGNRAGKLRLGIYGAPKYLSSRNSDKLNEHRWLVTSGVLKHSPVGDWQSRISPDNIAFSSDSFVTLADIAETGLGLAVLPTFIGDASDALSPFQAISIDLQTDIWVAAHKDLFDTPRISELVEFFTDAISALEL